MVFQIKYRCRSYDGVFDIFPTLEIKYRVKGSLIWRTHTEFLDEYSDKINRNVGNFAYAEFRDHAERMSRLEETIDKRFDGNIENYVKEIAMGVIKKYMKNKLSEKDLYQKMNKYTTYGWKLLELNVDIDK